MHRYLLIYLLWSGFAHATLPAPKTWDGWWRGESYQTTFPRGEGTFLWDPEQDPWLISPMKAIQAARKKLELMTGKASGLMGLAEVSLVHEGPVIDHGPASWYFVVTFESERHAAGAVGEITRGGLKIVRLTF